MKDESEQSNPSTGSVGEPLAFAVMQPDSYVVVHSLHSAFAMRDMCGGGEIVPLYRQPQPTITGAEREAVQVARDAYADDDGNAECEEIAAVLSRLLERTK